METQGWTYTDWFDLHPEAGSFLNSGGAREYQVHGETVLALNWLHAEHMWLRAAIERAGEQMGRCANCHQPIRYAVVFQAPGGLYYMVGEDCAAFISSRLPRAAWMEKRRLSDISQVETKNGTRFVLRLAVPDWFWALDKARRPAFTSLSKKPGRNGKPPKWSITVWGADCNEVLRNYEILKELTNHDAMSQLQRQPI